MDNAQPGNRKQRRAWVKLNRKQTSATATAFRGSAKKATLTGVAAASAIAVSVAPFTADAATYIVGAPDWLGVDNIDNDADAIYNKIVKDREKPAATIVGWGTGGVDLKPTWVNWYNPNLGGLDLSDVDLGSILSGDLTGGDLTGLLSGINLGQLLDTDKDQHYSLPTWGDTGQTETVWVENEAYKDAYREALDGIIRQDKDLVLNAEKITVTFTYSLPQPSWWTYGHGSYSLKGWFGDWEKQTIFGYPVSKIEAEVTIDNPFKGDEAKLDEFLDSGVYTDDYPVVINDPLKALGVKRPSGILAGLAYDWLRDNVVPKTINVGDVPYSFTTSKFKPEGAVWAPGESWDERARAEIPAGIEQFIPEQRPIEGWLPGGWVTTTYGQWVSPTDDITGLDQLDLSALLSGDVSLDNIAALTGLSTRDLGYYLTGDLGFLAPWLNWTTYIHNTNLIGFGDGAISAGVAYQKFIDAVKSGEIKAGAPQTGGRYIKITADENGNPLVQEVNRSSTTGQVLEEIITSYPLPGDLNFPGMPRDAAGNPLLPAYEVVKPGGVLDLHLFTLTLLRNPGRANGGLYARFAPVYEALTGVNPVSPDSQNVLPEGLEGLDIAKLLLGGGDSGAPSVDLTDLGELVLTMERADGKPMVITIKSDITWQYDILSDAPVTASPVAWANSLVASLLVAQLGESLLSVLDGDTSNLPGFVSYVADDGTFYGTLTTTGLPLLSPIRLVANAIGAATGLEINTPLADAFEPLLKTLTNVAYTDWERNENADGTISYDRTLDEMHKPVLFGTQTMTNVQKAQLASDLISILGAGIGAEITDINGRLLNGVKTILDKLGVDLPAELEQALAKAVTFPGDGITKLSANIGQGVSKVLTDVVEAGEPKLPTQLQSKSVDDQQKELASAQREVGKVAKRVKELTDRVSDRTATLANDLENQLTKDDGDETKALKVASGSPEKSESTDKSDSAEKPRKTPIKDAVKKAQTNLKKAVDRTTARVKAAASKKKDTSSDE